jgi:hypothetical protein
LERRLCDDRRPHAGYCVPGDVRFTLEMTTTGWERIVTLLSGAFLAGVFVYIQLEVWPSILGGGA